MKLTSEHKNELVRKLNEARVIADTLLQSTRQNEPTSGLVDMYTKTVEAIDRRILAIQDSSSLELVPKGGVPSQLGLYRGVSEWCEDDKLLDKVAEIEDYFVAAQQ